MNKLQFGIRLGAWLGHAMAVAAIVPVVLPSQLGTPEFRICTVQ